MPKQVRAKCSKCGLATKWVDEFVDYCAKEEAAKVWNKRNTEINQDDFGGLTTNEFGRALVEGMQKVVAMENPEEEKHGETPQCPICGHRGYNIREIGSDGFNTYVIMTCRNCDTEIRTDKEKIDKFFWKDWYKILKNNNIFLILSIIVSLICLVATITFALHIPFIVFLQYWWVLLILMILYGSTLIFCVILLISNNRNKK